MKFSLIAIAASCALTASAFAMNTAGTTSAYTGHAPRLSLTDITPINAPRLADITPINAPRLADITPINAPRLADITPINAPRLADITPINAPR